ncbi:MAG: response regulator transcription factor [Leptolyngbyaceae cyanobacterium bins.302]|nr:response regulator transcription factor [Leptolyngbyaceae cyanobacterium bins.302]
MSARILIVEDEVLVAREIESHLNGMGYTVVGIAIAPKTVIQQVATTLPDLVLMDINLPGSEDGVTLAGDIRDRFHIPVVYVTAYTDSATLDRVKATDPYGYILKPFSAPALRVAVELALSRQQTHQEQITPASSQPASVEFSPEGLPPNKLQAVLLYIEDNLNQPLSLEVLAQVVGMSSYYFARLFKQSTGRSVHQYIIHQRIERAKQLLRGEALPTDQNIVASPVKKSIAEIARECGFANPSHLALHFKRIVGVTPKQFQRF